MKLFDDVVPIDKQHAIYRLIKEERYAPERAVPMEWADGESIPGHVSRINRLMTLFLRSAPKEVCLLDAD